MVTPIDIARRAGVSKSTVSNVIRGDPGRGDHAATRVERAIAETGYHPNAVARSLKSRASMAIGIVVPGRANSFYTEPRGRGGTNR
jgi:DNA-binding LacI/PurR family transcriptional regulator